MSGTTVGVFTSIQAAEGAVTRLKELGIDENRITVLIPGESLHKLEEVPTTPTEQEGMGPALAGAIAGGLGLGVGVAIFLPAVGPITVLGAVAAALLGAGSAAAGAAAGASLENASMDGLLPVDELYIYEDALSKGRTVVVVSGRSHVEKAHSVLVEAGAESIDAAKEDWWVGIRDAERLEYSGDAREGNKEEHDFRRGFEAALRLAQRGKSNDEIEDLVQEEYPELRGEQAFVRGYKRGLAYWRRREERVGAPATRAEQAHETRH
jgi:hypothetical protein